MAQQQDPFLDAQQDTLDLLASARSLQTSYTRIRSTASSATQPELVDARREFAETVEELASDLSDLEESVRAVEGDPYRYGLRAEEVARRRKLVRDVRAELEQFRRLLDSKTHSGAAAAAATGGADKLPDPRAFDDEDDYDASGDDSYAQFEQQRQQELLQEQDVALDGVFKTVGNLRMQADEMGRELEEQGELLDSVDNITDRVGSKLNLGVKKIGSVLKNNEDTWSSCCIGLLILVLIIILILILVV